MVAFHQATLISLLLLLLYFVWMDVNLYHKIQNTNISKFPPSVSSDSSSSDERPHLFSPFAGFSVKMILLDQGSNYVYVPLADAFEKVSITLLLPFPLPVFPCCCWLAFQMISYAFVHHFRRYYVLLPMIHLSYFSRTLQVTSFSQALPSVTPNMISVAGVIFASIAARFILFHDIRMHRLAVFVFQVMAHSFVSLSGIANDQGVASAFLRPSYIRCCSFLSVYGNDSLSFICYSIGCYISSEYYVTHSTVWWHVVERGSISRSASSTVRDTRLTRRPIRSVLR